MTHEECKAWTSRVISMPFHQGLCMLVQQYLETGETRLIAIRAPESPSEWEFNSRVEVLLTAFEKFERAKILSTYLGSSVTDPA